MQYQPNFIELKPILSESDSAFLYALSDQYPLSQLLNTPRSINDLSLDFVYTSAQIEGNTYSKLDTDALIQYGITAGGKRYTDAVMILRLREALNTVLTVSASDKLDTSYVCALHKQVMTNLLPDNQQGLMRSHGVRIGGTGYTPLNNPNQLRQEFVTIFENAQLFNNPFERAIYLHCNLAYLQYFSDGNKRTSRLMQTACLVQADITPLFFHENFIDSYKTALITYYETGNYQPYVEFFKANYEFSITGVLPFSKDNDSYTI